MKCWKQGKEGFHFLPLKSREEEFYHLLQVWKLCVTA